MVHSVFHKTKLDDSFGVGGEQMTVETITGTKLVADKDMILTNGEVYGKVIFLASTDKPENYHEITEEGYNELVK